MLMNTVSELVMYLSLIAAMAERLTQTFKTAVDLNALIKNEKLRGYAIQASTLFISFIAACIYPPTDLPILKNLPVITSVGIVTLLGSTGSNIWHDLIAALTAFKEKTQASVPKKD